MSKNTLLSNLINYISSNSSGNVVIAAPSSGYALDVTGTGRYTGALTLTAAANSITTGNDLRFYRTDNAIYTTMYDAGSGAANGFILNNTNGEGFHFKNGSTTIMRMNSAGNVGVGTSSPNVSGQGANVRVLTVQGISGSYGGFEAGAAGSLFSGALQGFYGFTNSSVTGGLLGYIGGVLDGTSSSATIGSSMTFNTKPDGSNVTVERMKITASGNIGIGTSTPVTAGGSYRGVNISGSSGSSLVLSVGSMHTYIYTGGDGVDFAIENSGAQVFRPGNTERMRIMSGGQILMHSTAYNSALSGQLFGTSGQTYFTTDNNVFSGSVLYLNKLNGDGILLEFQKNTTQTGYISTNTYALPSDLNFKKNINTLDLGLDLITKLRPVSYNHKIDDDDAALSTGFIAQELEQSLNELGVNYNEYYILQHKPNEKVGESQYWLDYTKMIPILTKAIQEQQAQIEELKQLINN
jgi:hypothetical protein